MPVSGRAASKESAGCQQDVPPGPATQAGQRGADDAHAADGAACPAAIPHQAHRVLGDEHTRSNPLPSALAKGVPVALPRSIRARNPERSRVAQRARVGAALPHRTSASGMPCARYRSNAIAKITPKEWPLSCRFTWTITRPRRWTRAWWMRCCRTFTEKFGNSASRNHALAGRPKRRWRTRARRSPG